MKSGDRCPECPIGQLVTYSSKNRGDIQVQYLRCDKCGFKPPAERIEASAIRRRRPRVKKPV